MISLQSKLFGGCLVTQLCLTLFATPWTAAHQTSLSFTISHSLPMLMSIELMIPSNISKIWLIKLPKLERIFQVFINSLISLIMNLFIYSFIGCVCICIYVWEYVCMYMYIYLLVISYWIFLALSRYSKQQVELF